MKTIELHKVPCYKCGVATNGCYHGVFRDQDIAHYDVKNPSIFRTMPTRGSYISCFLCEKCDAALPDVHPFFDPLGKVVEG